MSLVNGDSSNAPAIIDETFAGWIDFVTITFAKNKNKEDHIHRFISERHFQAREFLRQSTKNFQIFSSIKKEKIQTGEKNFATGYEIWIEYKDKYGKKLLPINKPWVYVQIGNTDSTKSTPSIKDGKASNIGMACN